MSLPKMDSGAKYDQGLINKIIALVIDLSDEELSLLIDRLLQEKYKRKAGRNIDTIHG